MHRKRLSTELPTLTAEKKVAFMTYIPKNTKGLKRTTEQKKQDYYI